ncbi:MAG: polysaccharide export outer membrane protein [Flavobacteriales bacterium]|jgi:polysaccharide export outer membrane protein
MMRTDSDYPYSEFGEFEDTEYRLAADDVVQFQLFPNDGFQMINVASEGANAIGQSGIQENLLIEFDGFMKLPKLGRTYMEGLTLRQTEMVLEEKFSAFYNKPFVLLKVVNKRVTIIAGGNSQVVPLENENTTLLEALAKAGGIPLNGIASKVKLVRGNLKNPDVFLLDLSTITGMKRAELVLQSNDIIYIETKPKTAERITQIIAPYASILSSLVLIYTLATQLGK